MSLCVNINSTEFKETAKRLDIDEGSLEIILHEYMNTEGNETSFPSDSYILSKVEGSPITHITEKGKQLIEKKYAKPITVDTYADAQAVMKDMMQYFEPRHIGLKKTLNGKYQVTLGKVIEREDTREETADLLEAANNRRMQNIVELESDVASIETELKSLDRKKFINQVIEKVNSRVKEAQREAKFGGKVTSDGLYTFINSFNRKYSDLIDKGIIQKLDSSISNRISTFDRDGRVYYDLSKAVIKRDIQAIKAEAREQLQSRIKDLNDRLEKVNEDLRVAQKANLYDVAGDTFYQIGKEVADIEEVIKKLKPINKKFGALGSVEKINDFLKRADIPNEVRNALVEGYKAMPTTLKDMTPYEGLQFLASTQYKGLVAQYNESIRKPQNVLLEQKLADYLKQYNFEINVGDAVKQFGDFTGVLDIINKVIYVANNRNETTLPEEFGHAFVELLGSVTSRREENKDFTFLMNTVENTELYKQVFEDYKNVYKREDGTPDIYKIKKEAIGQGVGLAILSQYNGQHEETRNFFQRLKDLVEKILNKFRGSEYLSFESLVDKMAQEVLEGSTKRLDKVNKAGYNLLDYYKTIEEQNKKDGGKALAFMQYFTSIGNEITGSLAYRLQGTVYRPGLDSLHDIDMHVPPSAHGIDFNNSLIRNAIMSAMARNQEELFDVLTNKPYFSQIKEKYPKIRFGAAYPDKAGKNRVTVNAVYSEDTSLSDRFLKMSGSYAERLNNFTEEERAQIYLFDFFLVDEESTGFFEPTYGLQLSAFDTPIREKRWMGRAKDIMDYQNWRVFDEFKNKVLPRQEDLMYQVNPDTKKAQETEVPVKEESEVPAVDENGLSIPNDTPQRVRPSLGKFQQYSSQMVHQISTLLNSPLMSNTEIRHVAEQVVYFISDTITECMENPKNLLKMFSDLAVKDGRPMTEEEINAEAERLKGFSRVEIVKYIGLSRLSEFAKLRLFDPAGNTTLNGEYNPNLSRALIKKANLIKENFDAILQFANDSFTTVENFAIVTTDGSMNVIDADPLQTNAEDFEEHDEDRENARDGQESWQLEVRTIDVLTSMSQLVKQAINKCFQVKINEAGQEEIVHSEFGIAERINAKDATSSILRWTRGAESLSHMVEMLKAKAPENPWINQIIKKLEDNTGNEADFQSQFYGVFAKAFQPYSVVLKEYNDKSGQYEYKSIQVNQHPALREATQGIEVAFKTNTHPMFDNMKLRKDVVETLTAITNDLVSKAEKDLEENDRAEVIDLITKATNTLGYGVDQSTVNMALDSDSVFQKMVNKLNKISESLNSALGQEGYEPFRYGKKNSISGYLADFLSPLTERLEDTAVSSFYDSGKMYQSYVTPSYLTVLMDHFAADDARFQEFLQREYGQYEWFKNPDGTWRNVWLETLSKLPLETVGRKLGRKDLFKHKVQLNFNKHNYMKNMSDVEYALSVLSEYASEMTNTKGYEIPAWFRVPMLSNKPSSEFIKMYAYTGEMMRPKLVDGFSKIFQQELSRIQTVEIRDYSKKDPNFIKSFDKNGKKFMMLTFFNKYLEGGAEANSELGRLINKAIKEGTAKLTEEENAKLNSLASTEIETSMDNIATRVIEEWKSNGIFEGAKQITNLSTDPAVLEEKLREFIWNDTFASMNILELTITDPAFYKDAEDLQKRLAQIHAPGIRANIQATDYKGNLVTDGKFRTILLKDFDNFISNIKSNLRVVFDRKLKELENQGFTKDSSRYKAESATYDAIINQFDNINVADAEGYSCPTSYRKKAFIFGRWSKSAENIYEKLKAGTYTYSDIKTAFQPLKPFVYGQIERPGLVNRDGISTPLSKLKVPVQFKNSEYLLIMADAILQGEDTGKPNLLRAIYEVMEESAEKHPLMGLDTVQFESTCKSGLQGAIDINKFYDVEGGEILAKQELERAIYKADGSYNSDTYVYEVPFENYAIQQEVPEHFREHDQAHGSQIRMIIPSDLEYIDSDGNPVTYNYFDRGEYKQLSAEEFRKEYELNISQNIEDSISELAEQLGIGNTFLSRKDRNIALSEVLLKEILSSPRYGAELAVACTVDSETGEFNIPLGDPIQSKRIEQLINSIVKNRINKQEIAGGPVVQVSNFGTSRELNIRFNSKDGGLLMTRAEFEKSGREGSFEDYIKKNQAGIAYYEVFAPIFSNELFENFADKDGNIDIETIEKISPDLLKMIGYRIPTEDKYSMAPLKIVGFLPREAGEGIMLPNDITLLTGSDFDVDKFYLMRKEINITRRFTGDLNSAIVGDESYVKQNKTTIKKEILKRLNLSYDKVKLSDAIKGRVEERADAIVQADIERENTRYQYDLDAANRQKEESLARTQRIYDRDADAIEAQFKSGEITEDEYNSRMDKLDSANDRETEAANDRYEKAVSRITKQHEGRLSHIRDERNATVYDLARTEQKEFIKKTIDSFLENPFGRPKNSLERQIKDVYTNYMFDFVEPTEGRIYRNNKIVDMSWAVLTNETTASKMLTPGGFEPEKRMGYLISAYQNPANNFSWAELSQIALGQKGLLDGKIVDIDPNNKDIETGTDALKSLCYTEKNLCFFDAHLQFYKQNAAAATALGMAAVQKVAHATLESNRFYLDVSGATNTNEFTLAGKKFSQFMEVDKKFNDNGELIGRTLGEFVAMFADAVKDPVANLMNINNTTMPIVTALIRLGVPFETAALFISQPIIKRVLDLYNSENVTNFVRLSEVINTQISEIEKEFNIEDESILKTLDTITEEELIKNLAGGGDVVTNYKVLKFFQNFDNMAKALKSPTYATRFNSISNAVGPLVIDNLIKEYKADYGDFNNFYMQDEVNGDFIKVGFNNILALHPILGSFYESLYISREALDELPANSYKFRNMLLQADETDDENSMKRILFGDRKILSELSDYFQSYLLIASGAIPTEATAENKYQGLKYYIEQFPADFMRGNAKEIFKGNALIDAIRLDVQKGRAILRVDTTGLTTQEKEKLGDGWADLYRSGDRGKKLAEHLFYYNFWRTGIGFSPKSFMNLFPTRLKSSIPGYNEAFSVHSPNFAANVLGSRVLEQFVRSNADNNKLVPKVKIGEGGAKPIVTNDTYLFSGEDYSKVSDKPYIKIKKGGADVLLKRVSKNNKEQAVYFRELSLLGNNGEYFEASLKSDYQPLAKTSTVKQQVNEGQMTETSNSQQQVQDVPIETENSKEIQTQRATELRNILLEMFKMSVGTEEGARAKMAEFKAKSAKEKEDLKVPMEDFMKRKFEQLGRKFDQSLLDELYNELC